MDAGLDASRGDGYQTMLTYFYTARLRVLISREDGYCEQDIGCSSLSSSFFESVDLDQLAKFRFLSDGSSITPCQT